MQTITTTTQPYFSETSGTVQRIPLDMILPNPLQPRKTFSQENLSGLAATIKEMGLIHPIEVFEMGGKFILTDGERRWRAARLAGLTEIDALVKPAPENEMLLLRAIVANVQAEPMNPIEEGQAYRQLMEEYSKSVDEIARRTGKPRSHILNRILLTTLDPEIQELIAQGELHQDARVARSLLKIPDTDARVSLAKSLAKRKASIPQCVDAAKRMMEAVVNQDKEALNKVVCPAMALATRGKAGVPTNWNALTQLGKLLPWENVVKAATQTCNKCELKDMASKALCGRCQAVDLLTIMIAGASK